MSNIVVTLISVVTSLWLVPYSLRFLDREAYGIFAIGLNLVVWLRLLDIGFTPSLSVHLGRRFGVADSEETSRYISTTFFTQLVVVLLILIAGVVLAIGFPSFFEVSPELHQTSILMMILLTLGIGVNLATNAFSAALVAHQQMLFDNIIRLGSLVLQVLLTILFLNLGLGMLSLALAYFLCYVFTGTADYLRVRQIIKNLRVSPRLVDRSLLKKLGKTGIWLSVGSIAGLIIGNLDRAVTGKLISLEAVTILTLTGRTYLQVQELLSTVTNMARPGLAQLLGQGKKEQALDAYKRIFSLSTGLCIVVAGVLLAVNHTFVTIWVGGENYGGLALDIALALSLLVNVWNLPNRAILTMGLVVKQPVIARIVEGTLNITLSIVLTTQFGLVGVAISTAIAAFISTFFYLPYLTAKLFDKPYLQFLFDEARGSFFGLILMIPVVAATHMITNSIGGLVGVIIGAALTGIIGLAISWFVIFTPGLKAQILKLLLQMFTRVKNMVAHPA